MIVNILVTVLVVLPITTNARVADIKQDKKQSDLEELERMLGRDEEGAETAPASECVVPKCVFSDLSLDSALATFLCINGSGFGSNGNEMEEAEKLSLLVDNVAPHVKTDLEELEAMGSYELIELVNLVTYGKKLNKVGFNIFYEF